MNSCAPDRAGRAAELREPGPRFGLPKTGRGKPRTDRAGPGTGPEQPKTGPALRAMGPEEHESPLGGREGVLWPADNAQRVPAW